MEQEESMKQASIQFRCRKIAVPGTAKLNDSFPAAATQFMKADGDQDSVTRFESPTPEKPECRSRINGLSSSLIKGKHLFVDSPIEGVVIQSDMTLPETTNNLDSSETGHSVLISSQEYDLIELPEEHKTLSILFERMNSSIKLLALRKRLPTFRDISTQVEILSKRKFLCSHLAQMKHAFPEAIQIEKILIHDERSLCMIPDMKVTLVQDVVECPLNPGQSASMVLCNAFRARLLNFLKTHPEGTDIPQAALPEPFNPGNRVISKMLSVGSSKESPRETSIDLVLSGSSHFSSSFHQQFSQKIIPETQNIEIPAFPGPLVSISTDEGKELRNSPQTRDVRCCVSSVKSPAGVICTPSCIAHQNPEIAPAKHFSAADAFITETPSLWTPKRPVPTMHKMFLSEDEKSAAESKSANSARRSLIFSSSEIDENLANLVAFTSAQDEAKSYTCRKPTRCGRTMFGDEIVGPVTNQVQVVSAAAAATGMRKDHNRSQVGQEKGKDSLGCLLGMFDTICLLLRSTDCSFITKQELVHKIILNNLDIEESEEVEDQLQLLEDLVPDWISKKIVPNGDCFYCIKKACDQESVRSRLVEAV